MPDEWKLPLLFKTIPKNMVDDIKLRHKYAKCYDKTYTGLSKIMVELANEKRYEAGTGHGKDDMDVDALAAAQQAVEPPSKPIREWTKEECKEYETHLQEEWDCSATKGKGKGKGRTSFLGKAVEKRERR